MISNYKKGIISELLAAFLLSLKGYKIIERRFKSKLGEIDLICNKNHTVIFIEVKYRKNKEEFFDVIQNKQITRIINASKLYLLKRKFSLVRYDVIFIKFPFYFKHVKNAFYCENF